MSSSLQSTGKQMGDSGISNRAPNTPTIRGNTGAEGPRVSREIR